MRDARSKRGRSSLAVDVGAMLDRDDIDLRCFLADAVDDTEVAAPCAVQTLQLQAQRLADALRVLCKWSVAELDDCARDLLGQPGQCAAGRGRPADLE
jgi:hypothetical protein